MAPLTNAKRELFCQQIIEGTKFSRTQGDAYIRSGYRASGHAAETNASRLLKNADIQRRLAELGGKGARNARVTAQSLIEKLDVVFNGSVADKQYSAAGRAVETQGKLAGVMIDRTEIGGPGEFAEIKNVDDVARAILAESSLEDALAVYVEIRDALLRIAAERAQDVTPSELAAPNNEVNRALAVLRPERETRRSR